MRKCPNCLEPVEILDWDKHDCGKPVIPLEPPRPDRAVIDWGDKPPQIQLDLTRIILALEWIGDMLEGIRMDRRKEDRNA